MGSLSRPLRFVANETRGQEEHGKEGRCQESGCRQEEQLAKEALTPGTRGPLAAQRESVFINVPFDRRYRKLFHALVFTVHECGFSARCALEGDDGSQMRMEKLYDIIRDCPLGIHDLSRTTLDSKNRLPRFNMPLELGIFLGAKRYGGSIQSRKSCLILERDLYRYQKFCSDIAGQDIRAHHDTVADAIVAVRNWLRASRPAMIMPGGGLLAKRYVQFRFDFPRMCKVREVDRLDPPFIDYRTLVAGWLEENPRSSGASTS